MISWSYIIFWYRFLLTCHDLIGYWPCFAFSRECLMQCSPLQTFDTSRAIQLWHDIYEDMEDYTIMQFIHLLSFILILYAMIVLTILGKNNTWRSKTSDRDRQYELPMYIFLCFFALSISQRWSALLQYASQLLDHLSWPPPTFCCVSFHLCFDTMEALVSTGGFQFHHSFSVWQSDQLTV